MSLLNLVPLPLCHGDLLRHKKCTINLYWEEMEPFFFFDLTLIHCHSSCWGRLLIIVEFFMFVSSWPQIVNCILDVISQKDKKNICITSVRE